MILTTGGGEEQIRERIGKGCFFISATICYISSFVEIRRVEG